MSNENSANVIAEAIQRHQNWIGQTTRELRNEVERQAKATNELTDAIHKNGQGATDALNQSSTRLATELGKLTATIEHHGKSTSDTLNQSSDRLAAEVGKLTAAIDRNAESSGTLSVSMVWLTRMLVILAAIQAAAAMMQAALPYMAKSLEPTQSAPAVPAKK